MLGHEPDSPPDVVDDQDELTPASVDDSPDSTQNETSLRADAGPDLTVIEGQDVALAGTTSYDDLDLQLSFVWQQSGGLSAESFSASGRMARFTAPQIDQRIKLSFLFTARAGSEETSDGVDVTVLDRASAVETESIEISASPAAGPAPLWVILSAQTSSTGASSALRYVWDYGDQSALETGSDIQHVFSEPGDYTVALYAIEGSGEQAALIRTLADILVEAAEPAVGGGAPSSSNRQPEVTDLLVSTERDTPLDLVLTGSDHENQDLTFAVVSPPQHGSLETVDNSSAHSATARYWPAAGFTGPDTMSFQARDGVMTSRVASGTIWVLGDRVPPMLGNRVPQWPLKTSRALLTDDQISQARMLCQTDTGASVVLRNIRELAEPWLEYGNEELRQLLPDARVFRAFNVSTKGCPIHGEAIYQHGTYPWVVDPADPFSVTCPVGGERYPSNDFGTYYRDGMRDPSLLTGDYVDDGQGWVSPDGERYWFVGYGCHWNWLGAWKDAVTVLSQAYALTGERAYAEKAIVMLDRIAEVYPPMDWINQSRYGELLGGGGRPSQGKMTTPIWATFTLKELAIAYDLVFDALVGSDPISLPWRDSQQIRANIEANLLEEGLDAIQDERISGNFGMHQRALAYTMIVRQNGPTGELLDSILANTGGESTHEGLNYALYNLVYKDGMPNETAPGYCFGWVEALVETAEALAPAGVDLYAYPKLKLMLDAPLQLICPGDFTPANGDAGTLDSGWLGPKTGTYQSAYARFGNPSYAWVLHKLGRFDLYDFSEFEDLFQDSILNQAEVEAQLYEHQPRSRFLDGYGMAILNNDDDSAAVSINYGIRGGHGHYDRLNIEVFGQGHRLSPDLGYPDAANAFVSGIFSWSTNTVSHNCLVVDDGKQTENVMGKALRFHDSAFAHVVDIDAAGSYPQTDVYRRTLVFVDAGPDDAYLVDVFRARGGQEHVLSMHGQEGTFDLTGSSLSAPVTAGTLAGSDVAYGELYDDPILGDPDYTGKYRTYAGSGYQHLFNWQSASPQEMVVCRWMLEAAPSAQLRVHVPPHNGQELIVADAYVSPLKTTDTKLKYVLLDRNAGPEGNTFVNVWELAGAQPFIDRVEVHAVDAEGIGHDEVIALSVYHGDRVDAVLISPYAGRPYVASCGFTSAGIVTGDAVVAVLRQQHGTWTDVLACGGSRLATNRLQLDLDLPATVLGNVEAVDHLRRKLTVRPDSPLPDTAGLVGRTLRVFNEHHSCVYTIASAQANGDVLTIGLAESNVFTGRVKLASVDAGSKSVTTDTTVPYAFRLSGMSLLTDDLLQSERIVAMEDGTITLDQGASLEAFDAALGSGGTTDAWIADFGIGDQIEIEQAIHINQRP